MTKNAPKRLRLFLSLISIILSCNLSFGENESTIGSKRLIPALEVSSSLSGSDIPTHYFLMEDTVCTSVTRDTFYVNTLPNIDSYNWTVPNGTNIVSTLGDTMIILDWTNAVPGLADICIETMNNCGVGTPVCFPIRIIVCNLAPEAVDDQRTTPSNTPVLVTVQSNDSDLDNDQLTTGLDLSDSPTNGTVTIVGSDIRYTPNLNFTGIDDFQYFICDDGNPMFCDTALVTIIVENSPPNANPDVVSTIAGVAITVPVQDNDSDPESHDLTTALDASNNPTQGTVTLAGDNVIYTPNGNATGSDEFGYVICDNGNPVLCDTTTVTINLDNQAPMAMDDRDTTLSNQPIIVAVQVNDTDLEGNNLITTLESTNPPSNGMVAIINNSIQYTPNTDFTGNDTFDYIVCDDGTPSKCDTATVDIVVLNQKPIAVDDLAATTSGIPVTIPVQNNDSDPENDVLTTTLDSNNGPSNGTATLSGNDIIYTPGTGFSGTDNFDYIICDDDTPSLCDTATVTISTENQAPTAIPDNVTTPFETPITVEVQNNDSDPENGVLATTLNPNFPPSNGTVAVTGDNIQYTPNTDFIGMDQFEYIICDDGTPSLCDTTVVTITVPNDRPIAVDDSNTTLEDTPVNGTLLENDADPNRHDLILNLVLINSPTNGTINLNPDGFYTYFPTANYHGTDGFFYQICDGQTPNLCDTAEVVITISAVNDAPMAVDDINSTLEETPVNGTVLPNDSDLENDNLTVSTTPVDEPNNGTLALNPDGTYTYTPDAGFNGTDSFQYEVCDDGTPSRCDTATVTISIGAVNDSPVAMDDPITTDEDTPVTGALLPNDMDPDGDNLMVNTTPVDEPENGTLTINPDGTFTYTPDPDFNGTDTFQYEVCDDGVPSLCDTATVTITVNPTNDAPVAMDDPITTDEDTPVTGALLPNDTDPDGDNLMVNTTPVDEPENGTLTINPDGTFTYTPDPNFEGTDTFQYEVCDDGTPVACDTAIVTITVNPTNDPPVAMDDPITTDEDTPVTGALLPNDTDPDGDDLMVNTTPVDEPNNGTLTINSDGTFTYTPDPDFNGTDTFQYEVCDDGTPILCDTATVTITVNPTNDAPVAMDDRFPLEEDTPLMANVLPNDEDTDGDNITVTTTPVEAPDNGTLSLNPDGTFTYIPAPAFNGLDTFLYELCDNGVPKLCDTAQVIIAIDPENDPPVAVDDIVVTPINEPARGNLLTNDFDPEGDNITVNTTPVDLPDNGTLTINPDGTYTYVPNPNFVGEDRFQYEICDDGIPQTCDTATVVIYIIEDNSGVNDPPVAINDNFVTNMNKPIVSVNLLTNDIDPDGDDLILNTAPINPPVNGTVFITPNGNATYTPATDYLGTDVFTYRICDNGIPILCDTATVNITILPSALIENSTYANDDAGLTYQDIPLIGILNDNDNDPEGDNQFLNTTPITNTSNGSITLNDNGTFEYIPNSGYVGADLFTYQVCDDGTPIACDLATVYLTVLVRNIAPYAIDDVNIIPKNGEAIGNLLANDFDLDGDNIIVRTTPIDPTDNGSLMINPDGTYVYMPNPDYVGEDIFTYQICDDGSPIKCDTATVTIEIIEDTPAVNNPPIGVNDVFITLINMPVESNLVANDFDPDGDEFTITTIPVSLPTNGSVTINADGTFEYIPNLGFSGDDYFNYQICDDQTPSLCTETVVSITVVPPVDGVNFTFANDDAASTREDTPVSGDLLANDNDPEGHTQSINPTPVHQPEHGVVVINVDGTYTYTPEPDYEGADQFTYTLCDNGTPSACAEARVYLVINGENDPPLAINDINNTIKNTPTCGFVLTNDTELGGDALVLNATPVVLPANGTVSLNADGKYTYTPNTDFVGEDTFEYVVCDDQNPALCDTAKVVIEVLDFDPSGNNPPNGVEDNVQTNVNTPVIGSLLSNDSDIDGDNLIINTTPINSPTNGVLTINPDGTFEYTPNPNFAGEDIFSYEVCDDGTPSLCDEVTVTIIVTPNPYDENRVFASDDAGSLQEDQTFTGDLLDNDSDPEGDNLVITTLPVTLPQNGTLTIYPDGTFDYLPFNNFYGADNFQYEVCDDQNPKACDTANVYLAILPLQDPPLAKDDINLTLVNTPVTGLVLTNDEEPDGDDLIVDTTPISNPANGTVSINPDGTYTYTPATDFSENDEFAYLVCDDQIPALCDTAIVSIKIIDTSNPANNPPVGLDDINFGIVNTPVLGNLTANDFDPDGDPFNITTTPIIAPTNGSIIINPNGTYTYTPNPDFVGIDELEYEICDLGNPVACDTATVKIEIFPNLGNTIFANDDAIVGNEDSPILGELLANDFDPQNDAITITTFPTRLPTHGTVTINTNGTFTYFPVKDYNGADQFEYEICDDKNPAACDIATAYLTILPVSDTLCAEPLPKPTLLTNEAVCFTDDIFLFIQQNYPLFTIENTDLEFEFMWFNSLGDTIATTTEPNFTLAANDPMAISPFTVRVKLDNCSSDFADPVAVDITQLPTIVATSTSGAQGVCVNGTTQLMATAVADAAYTWRVLGTTTIISTEQNPVISDIATTTTYEVQVKPALCEVFTAATITIEVNEGPVINPQIATESVVCLGSSFQLESNVSGIEPFTYQWTGPNNFTSNAVNPVISNASLDNSGSYTLTVIDGGGCSNSADLVVDAISASPTQPMTNSNSPACIDGNVEINLQSNYTGTTITYNWINGLGNTVGTDRNLILAATDAAVISPFTLQVSVDGCLSPSSELINVEVQDAPIALATSTTTTICVGEEIQVFGNEITGATYEWRVLGNPTIVSTLQNPIFRNIQQDTAFTLTVTGGACPDKYAIDTIQIGVSEPVVFNPNKIYSLNQDCSVSDLQLQANVEGSTNGLSFNWTGPNGFNVTEENPIIQGVTEAFNGAYSLAITNQNGCTLTKTIFINDLQGNIPTPVITALNTGCSADNIVLEAPLYEGTSVVYNWLKNGGLVGTNSNQLFIDDAQIGNSYRLVIQANGCIIESNTFEPLVFDQPTVVIEDNLPTVCTDGAQDITLNATIEGGQAPYEIVWTSTTGFQSFNEDAVIVNATEALSGTYSIEIVDQNGCSAKTSTILDIKEAPIQPIIQLEELVCEGGITTLSTANYEGVDVKYSWQVPNNQNISGLTSNEISISPISQALHQGDYTLTVEVDGCSSTSAPVQLEVASLPTIQPTGNYNSTLTCTANNLNLSANLSAATTPLTFEWTGPNGFSSSAENPVIVNATAANNGQYFLKITNNLGCSTSAATNIIDNIRDGIDQPVIQATTSLCEGETIVLTAPIYTGTAIKYTWFFNGQIIEDANNFELIIPQADPSLHQGNYNVLVEVDGCQSLATPVAINLLALPTINPAAIYTRTENCTGSNLVLNANLVGGNTGLSFEWTGPNGFSSNVENPVIVNATIENNGQYFLKVTNSSNCTQSTATNIINDISPVLLQPIIQTSEAVCEGGLMTLTAPVYTGATLNYTWLLNGNPIEGATSNEIIIGPLANNGDTYQVQIQVDDCALTSEEIIPNVLPMSDISPSYELSGLCEGNSLQLSANASAVVGSIRYEWTGPNGYTSNAANPFIGNINEDFNGTYNLTISTLAGCKTSKSITITEIINTPAQPTVLSNGPVCKDGMIELSVQATTSTNQFTFLWLNGQGDTIGRERSMAITTNDSLAIPPYFAKISMSGCAEVTSMPIQVPVVEIPQIAVSNNGPVCQGNEVQLSATEVENASYIWTDAHTGTIVSTLKNPTILNIDTTSTFNLAVTIPGCTNSSSMSTTVLVNQKSTITDLPTTLSLCEGQDLVLSATNGNPRGETITYTWIGPNDFNFTSESSDSTFPVIIPNFSASQVGAYQLTVGGIANCASETRSVVVGLNEELVTPSLTAATNLVCGGESISLTASTENGPGVRYEWYIQGEEGDLLLIRETTVPTMILSNASSANSGEYIVRVIKDNCFSGYSNTAIITVLDPTSNIIASNNTAIDNKICEGGVIQLAVPFYEGATYTWFGPAGYTSDKANPIISPATTLAAGDYFAIITVDGCVGITSSVTTVYVNPQPTTPTIINNGPVCMGETLIMEVSSELAFNDTDSLVYEWYDALSNALIRATTTPQLILTNVDESQSGKCYLRLIANGCEAEISNETEVEILSAVDLVAFAGDDQILCAASTINLNAIPVRNGMGIWTSPTGAVIADSTNPTAQATNLIVGTNQFVWSAMSDQCATQSSDTVLFEVEMIAVDEAFAGLDRDVCETDVVNLTATPLTQATGVWTQSMEQMAQGVIISNPFDPTTAIEGFEPGNSYKFIWTISEDECPNFDIDTVQLNINDMPPDNAVVREESIVLCEEDQLTLNAEIPTFSTGQWMTESGAIVANPTSPSTFVESLNPGQNLFVWALSNGACANYSTDTVTVHSERQPIINADNYEINLNDTLNMNVLENDVITDDMDIRFVVTKYPDNGELVEGEDGILTYKPQGNFFGFDNFRYKVCSQLCESLCDTAIVTIGVTGTEGSGDCIIPNVISPNDDGNNDYFLVSCIDQNPGNRLRIFNRWGDKVYETRNYQNDWAGTHDRQPLPAGTYFYMLQLSEEADPLQGFITIFR